MKKPRPLPEGKDFPIGTPVLATLDDGTKFRSRTRSMPWLLGGHTWVIMLDRISGGYALDRVEFAAPHRRGALAS